MSATAWRALLRIVEYVLSDPNSGVLLLTDACNALNNQIAHHAAATSSDVSSAVSLAGLGALVCRIAYTAAVRTANLAKDTTNQAKQGLFLGMTRLLCYCTDSWHEVKAGVVGQLVKALIGLCRSRNAMQLKDRLVLLGPACKLLGNLAALPGPANPSNNKPDVLRGVFVFGALADVLKECSKSQNCRAPAIDMLQTICASLRRVATALGAATNKEISLVPIAAPAKDAMATCAALLRNPKLQATSPHLLQEVCRTWHCINGLHPAAFASIPGAAKELVQVLCALSQPSSESASSASTALAEAAIKCIQVLGGFEQQPFSSSDSGSSNASTATATPTAETAATTAATPTADTAAAMTPAATAATTAAKPTAGRGSRKRRQEPTAAATRQGSRKRSDRKQRPTVMVVGDVVRVWQKREKKYRTATVVDVNQRTAVVLLKNFERRTREIKCMTNTNWHFCADQGADEPTDSQKRERASSLVQLAQSWRKRVELGESMPGRTFNVECLEVMQRHAKAAQKLDGAQLEEEMRGLFDAFASVWSDA